MGGPTCYREIGPDTGAHSEPKSLLGEALPAGVEGGARVRNQGVLDRNQETGRWDLLRKERQFFYFIAIC